MCSASPHLKLVMDYFRRIAKSVIWMEMERNRLKCREFHSFPALLPQCPCFTGTMLILASWLTLTGNCNLFNLAWISPKTFFFPSLFFFFFSLSCLQLLQGKLKKSQQQKSHQCWMTNRTNYTWPEGTSALTDQKISEAWERFSWEL